MEKQKKYNRAKFNPEVISEAVDSFKTLVNPNGKSEVSGLHLHVEVTDAQWSYDNEEEFFADYRHTMKSATYELHLIDLSKEPYVQTSLPVSLWYGNTEISISAPTRQTIEAVFGVFEKHLDDCRLPKETIQEEEKKPTIFIGHGHSNVWRDLKDHLHEQHGFPIEAYETGARAGHAIRDVLEEMAENSSFALLVLTCDDQIDNDKYRARQNVIHETGLFQGRLSFSRTIVLLENGVEEFSNISGIHQIRFSKGNIKETFGDVLATIRREFGSA